MQKNTNKKTQTKTNGRVAAARCKKKHEKQQNRKHAAETQNEQHFKQSSNCCKTEENMR